MTTLTSKQQEIVKAIKDHFGIEAKEVSLDESGELFFSLDALNQLAIRLAPDLHAICIDSHSFNNELKIVTSHASITRQDGVHRSNCKSAQVGEVIFSGTIDTLIQAANIADSRAARAALRAIGFDPIREIEAIWPTPRHYGNQTTFRKAKKDRRYIHKVRDDLDMDDAAYRTHLRVATGERFESTEKNE